MESRQAPPAAQILVTPCRRRPTCPYLRRRRCLFFHSEHETASASLVGQDQHRVSSVMERIARLERVVEQILGTPVPQIMKDSGIMPQHTPAGARAGVRGGADRRSGLSDRPTVMLLRQVDQTCRVFARSAHRQTWSMFRFDQPVWKTKQALRSRRTLHVDK